MVPVPAGRPQAPSKPRIAGPRSGCSPRGVFPASLEASGKATTADAVPAAAPSSGIRFGTGTRRKEITAFSRELAALLGAAIPIPQALEGIADAEAIRSPRRAASSASSPGAPSR